MDITIQNLVVDFIHEQGVVLEIKELTLFHKNITAIIGESGSGKSVLGKSIVGLVDDARVTGKIEYAGKNLLGISKSSLRKVRGKDIFFIPQDPALSLNPSLTVKEQLLEGLEFYDMYTSSEREEKIKSSLISYGFSDPQAVLSSYPFQLSGGMKQRIMCLMAFLLRPNWIIADEPTKGLDAHLIDETKMLFMNLRDALGCGLLFITHDIDLALDVSDNIVILESGKTIYNDKVTSEGIKTENPYVKELMRCQSYFKQGGRL